MLSVQVEDAVLDVYDLAYEWAARNLSGAPRQQLVAIQDTVSMEGAVTPPPESADRGPDAEPGSRDTGHRRPLGSREREKDLLSSPCDPGRAGCLIWGPKQHGNVSRPKLLKNIRLVTAQCELKQGPVATGSQPGRQGPQVRHPRGGDWADSLQGAVRGKPGG